MFKDYKLLVSTVNMSDGEADEVTRIQDEKSANQKFYDKLSQLGGNPQTKKVMIQLFDKDGNVIKREFIDNSKYITENQAK